MAGLLGLFALIFLLPIVAPFFIIFLGLLCYPFDGANRRRIAEAKLAKTNKN